MVDKAQQALGDLTVLELSEGIAGAWCGKLLAGLGARVIKIEPPGGERGRTIGPFKDDDPHPEKSGSFLYLNTAKQSVVLDLATAAGREVLLHLADTADVLIESFSHGASAALGLDFGAIRARHPRLIHLSITPFGQNGPYRDYQISEIVAEALGGLLYTIGLPEREPVKIGGSPSLYNAGGAAFSALMAAVFQRDRTGQGQWIDVSIQETTAITQIHASIEATWQGTNLQRRPSSLQQARDGWASVGMEMGVSADTWPRFCAMLGRPELVDDPRFATSMARRDNREAVQAIVEGWIREQPKEEIYHRLQAMRSIAGYVATAADLYHSAQLTARGFFQELDHPVAGTARYPGPPFRISGTSWLSARAPLLDEAPTAPPDPQFWGSLGSEQGRTAGTGTHGSTAVRTEREPSRVTDSSEAPEALGSGAPKIGGQGAENPADHVAPIPSPSIIGGAEPNAATGKERYSELTGAFSEPPLAGVRILDLTQVAVGPYTTLLLGGLGAEVIKVESNRRPDITRGPVQPTGETQLKQYPDGDPGERPWNRAAFFNQRNRGKLGVTLDLSSERGKQLFLRLVACCDAVAENFRASVLERQGLGWDVLHAVNPRLVYLKLSSQGNSGPEREYGSLGSTLEQTAGLVSITGYRDAPPLMTNGTYPDPVAGVLAAGALIAGLRQVARTGQGRFVDFSQREATVGLLGEAMMDYALNGRVQEPIGNRHPQFAPQGVYPCRGPGGPSTEGRASQTSPGGPSTEGRASQTSGDAWIAVTVESDEQWRRLREIMGVPDWALDPSLASAAGRRAHHDEIDAALATWTAGFDKFELMHLLQGLGIPAGAVLTGLDLLDDPQLNARGWWESVVPTEVGRPFKFVTAPWRLSASPWRPSTPAPCLGEHNDRVYLELLGLDAPEYAGLQRDGVISTEPLWVRA